MAAAVARLTETWQLTAYVYKLSLGGDENVSLADYYTHIELIKELIASYE